MPAGTPRNRSTSTLAPRIIRICFEEPLFAIRFSLFAKVMAWCRHGLSCEKRRAKSEKRLLRSPTVESCDLQKTMEENARIEWDPRHAEGSHSSTTPDDTGR